MLAEELDIPARIASAPAKGFYVVDVEAWLKTAAADCTLVPLHPEYVLDV